ncbi:MAG: hypothetical protein J6T13_01765 [Bacteroidales bacterium]|nr:hypothetical protein [Bacteroidales bacterium]
MEEAIAYIKQFIAKRKAERAVNENSENNIGPIQIGDNPDEFYRKLGAIPFKEFAEKIYGLKPDELLSSKPTPRQHIVFLTGAGISAESGLETFRGEDGMWTDKERVRLASAGALYYDTEKCLDFYNALRKKIAEAEPNEAHRIIARLEEEHEVTVITQNVDNLHERAGSMRVIHLHGELSKVCSSNVLAYSIREHQLDVGSNWEGIQSVRTYTADGKPNDENLFDHQCERHFKGRIPDQIRFKPGDIVEVINDWRAVLCVVWHTQPTVEDFERKRPYWLENHKKRCLEKGIEYKEECFHWDYSDDCYVVYSLGEGDIHFHPESPEVFFPTKPVPKSLQAKLKAKYEEMLREAEEWRRQKENGN